MIRRLRTQQIIIDLPRTESEPWIHLIIQQVDTDEETGKDINVVDRYGRVSKKLSEVATDIIPYEDAVVGHNDNLSTLGLSHAITVMATTWIIGKYGGSVDDHGYIVI